MEGWIPIEEQLPEKGQRVLCWVPSNDVYLPGKTGEYEARYAIVLKFGYNWFIDNPSKTGKATDPHFWLGEGSRNFFFKEVTHWQALPEGPIKD